jgi:hypothetical protein
VLFVLGTIDETHKTVFDPSRRRKDSSIKRGLSIKGRVESYFSTYTTQKCTHHRQQKEDSWVEMG